ncbi:hypothetical protein ACOSQ3_016431 [Xanthoceras sorbifolium]
MRREARRSNAYYEGVTNQGVAEVRPLILLNTLTKATSEKLFVKGWGSPKIFPRDRTEVPTRRRESSLAHRDRIYRPPL